MKLRLPIACVYWGSLLLTALVQSSVRSEEVNRDVPGELIVSFIEQNQPVMSLADGSNTSIYQTLNDLLDQFHLSTVTPLCYPNSPQQNVFVFKFPVETNVDEVVAHMQQMPFIKGVEKNILMKVDLDYIPKDYACRHDWYCNGSDGRSDTWDYWSMQVDRAWDIERGDPSVVIAIMDNGVDYGHPELGPNMWQNLGEDSDQDGHTLEFNGSTWVFDTGDIDTLDNDSNDKLNDFVGWDFIGNDGDPITPLAPVDFSHGTQMASIVSCRTDDSETGTAGISWFSKLMALRCVLAKDPIPNGPGDFVRSSWVIGATNYAAAKGADIINMSFSSDTSTTAWHDAIIAADNAGVILVSSSGSVGVELEETGKSYPQWWEEVICVSAVDTFGYKTNVASNFGTTVDISGYSNATLGTTPDARGIRHIACVYDSLLGPNCLGGVPEVFPGTSLPHNFYYTALLTSGACAQASGVLALLKSMYPTASSSFLKQELYRGATPLPDTLWNPDIGQSKLGHGAINAYRSLTQWGTISQNTVWSNAVYVSGDITVADGATLTVSPGTTVYVMPDDNEHDGVDESRIEFWVDGGMLDVNGTSESPVRFIAWDESGETSDSTAWWGIFVTDSTGSGASFDYCTVKNASTGIATNRFIEVNHCTIEDCAKRGISVAYADSVYIANTTIRDIGPTDHTDAFGLNVVAGSTVRMENSTIENVGMNAAQVLSGSKLYVNSCHFLESDAGLFVWRDYSNSVEAIVQSSLFRHNYFGIEIVDPGAGAVSVTSSVLDSNGTTGMFCGNASNVTVRNSVIEDNPTGVWVYYSDVSARHGNWIQYNTEGMKFLGTTSAAIESTEVAFDYYGIIASSGGNPDVGHETGGSSVGFNRIHHNLPYHIQNLTSGVTIMAEMNWWRGQQPPSNRFYGSVDYVPWLQEEPEIHEAGIRDPIAPFEKPREAYPAEYRLSCNYPNPFNPVTTFVYEVPSPGGDVELTVYNVAGQMVASLVREYRAPGVYRITWNGVDENSPVASGVYFVQMRAGSYKETRKIMLLK